MIISNVDQLIKFHEGLTLVAKADTHGKYGIGYGHDGAKPGQCCTVEQANAWLQSDKVAAIYGASKLLWPEWQDFASARRAAFIDMAYELGSNGLAEFDKMLEAAREGRWADVKTAGLASVWAKQVPSRAEMDCEMLLTGKWPEVPDGTIPV
jgi:lysozyme